MVPMLRQLIGEDVQLTVSERAPGKVKVDPGQFEQVVMNLAVNARDAMPNGGTLGLAPLRVELSPTEAARLQVPPGAVHGDVRDRQRPRHGRRDAGAHLRAVLHDQADRAGHRARPVDGVRHPPAERRRHRRASRRSRSGTTFTVFLPVAAGTGRSHAARRRGRPHAKVGQLQGTVLVAEDEESVRMLVRTVLTTAGFRVLEASSGTEAAALLPTIEGTLELLITDIIMPGMIGPDLARLVLQRFPADAGSLHHRLRHTLRGPRGLPAGGRCAAAEAVSPRATARRRSTIGSESCHDGWRSRARGSARHAPPPPPIVARALVGQSSRSATKACSSSRCRLSASWRRSCSVIPFAQQQQANDGAAHAVRGRATIAHRSCSSRLLDVETGAHGFVLTARSRVPRALRSGPARACRRRSRRSGAPSAREKSGGCSKRSAQHARRRVESAGADRRSWPKAAHAPGDP